jgi:hypothetical protein
MKSQLAFLPIAVAALLSGASPPSDARELQVPSQYLEISADLDEATVDSSDIVLVRLPHEGYPGRA